VCDLVLGDAVGDFRVETGLRANDDDLGVGIEAVQNATGSNLYITDQYDKSHMAASGIKECTWANIPLLHQRQEPSCP
jgi:hypothetical protein